MLYAIHLYNTLIHNVTHTYQPEITELIPPTIYSTFTEQQTIYPTQFSLNQVYITDTDSLPQPPSLYNVHSTSHFSQQRVFPSLPFSPENLKFIHKFNFQFSDITDTEYVTLCNLLLKYKTCSATHKNDVSKIATPFRIRLKPNAQLLTQRPSKVPIHYRDKLNTLSKDLEKHNVIKQIGSSPQDKPVYGTTYLNPLIIIPKGDSIKSHLYEAFMVSKAFQIFLPNKCHHSLKHLLNKVLLLHTSIIFYLYQILKNTCFNLLNNYIILAQKITLNLLPKNPFSCSSKSSFWDMK